MSAASSVGRSPCTLTHDVGAALRVGQVQRLEDAVGAGGVVGAGHQRPAAGFLDRRPRSASDRSRPSTAPRPAASARRMHMLDHRLAGDVGQRLARQAARPPCGPG